MFCVCWLIRIFSLDLSSAISKICVFPKKNVQTVFSTHRFVNTMLEKNCLCGRSQELQKGVKISKYIIGYVFSFFKKNVLKIKMAESFDANYSDWWLWYNLTT